MSRFAAVFVLLTALALPSPAATGYRQPAKPILDVLGAPETPQIYVSPSRDYALLAERLRYPPIAEVAEPMLRLAGVRINPQTNGPHSATRYVGLEVVRLSDGVAKVVQLPAGTRISGILWSPDGGQFAFLNTRSDGIALWVGDPGTGSARRAPGITVNGAFGHPLRWMPDSRTLLVQTIAARRGEAPSRPSVPEGPVIQESPGVAGPVRTYQDLLKDSADEALFEYYATSQLALVNVTAGTKTLVGKPAVFSDATPSPDGRYLLVERILHPYSYLHPHYRFPHVAEVWDRAGKKLRELARLPLADNVPIGGVPTGPREYRWQPTNPATTLWVEALDEGNPKKKVPHRDRILRLPAPFHGDPEVLFETGQRFSGLNWGENGDFALVRDYDRDHRWTRTFLLDPNDLGVKARLIWSRASQDRYSDPGSPVSRTLPNGHRAIVESGGAIFLSGAGSSPQGDHPFLDRFDWPEGKSERLFHCDEDAYESVVAVLDETGNRILTRRETPTDPPNYYVRDLAARATTPITKFADPAPQIRSITKRRVTYQRDDGVPLSFTLYLPPGYKEGARLPTVVWAYPREYNTAKTAGQIHGSTKRFTLISGSSHLFFLLAGYAILDGASLPVIGDPETANNTYVEQIVAGAKAAIDKAVELGVTDRDRVGVGGHSYGAFMTANLLAHSDLFRAGIARSGAYNRTLTPFGFQNERRTFWEAPDIYFKMSPFMSANKINEPLLMTHGMADNNSGTFPIQSQRMYQAIRGNGGIVRLVMLPCESHGYAARESIEDTLAEMIDWFDRYVKHAKR